MLFIAILHGACVRACVDICVPGACCLFVLVCGHVFGCLFQ